jgi:hypothetical protein
MAPRQQLSSRLHLSATPLPKCPHQPNNVIPASPRRRRRRQSHTTKILGALICCVAVGCISLTLQPQSGGSDNVGIIARNSKAINKSRRAGAGGDDLIVQPVSLDGVVGSLMRLAEKRPAELWDVFGMDGNR